MKYPQISQSSHNVIAYFFILLAIALFIGCTSKKDEISNRNTEPCNPSTVRNTSKVVPSESNEPNMASLPAADNNNPNKTARNLNQSRDDADIPISSILAEFYNPISSDRKIELLDSLTTQAFEQDPNVIAVAQKALEDPNGEVGQSAIALLDGYEDPNILPSVGLALNNNDEEVRQAAIELLENVDDPRINDLLALALNDTSEDVRAAAINLLQKQEEIQASILANGISSPYEDVKEMAVSALESRSDKTAVDILINGLKDPNPEFRENVSDTLDSLIDKKFDNYGKAKAWWNANQGKYDADLTLRNEE